MVSHMGTNARASDEATAALAAAIRAVMGRKDVSAVALAEKSGVPLSTLRKSLKYGRVIDYGELRKIAQALGVSAKSIVEEAEKIEAGLL